MEPLFTVDQRHHGQGPVVFAWHPRATHVASTGASRVVQVCDRQGSLVAQIVLRSPAAVSWLGWSPDGDFLAVLQAGAPSACVWELLAQRTSFVEGGNHRFTWAAWAPRGLRLALGTARGQLLVHELPRAADPVVADVRHGKRVVCGAWAASGEELVFASEDRQLSVVEAATGASVGDPIQVKGRPVSLAFGGEGSLLAVNMDGRGVQLYDYRDEARAVDLNFSYGAITSVRWFGVPPPPSSSDGDGGGGGEEAAPALAPELLVGFASGHLVAVSAADATVGAERARWHVHSEALRDTALHQRQVATCGDCSVKLIDAAAGAELASVELEHEAGQLDKLAWTPDGRVLSVSTLTGALYSFAVAARPSSAAPAPSSLLALVTKPISASGMLFMCAFLVDAVLFASVHLLDVSLVDLVRALNGDSESL